MSGKTIKLTPEHPLLTVKGWIPAEELSLKSRIATPRKINTFGEKDLPESEVKLLAYLIAEGHLSINFILFSNIDNEIIRDFKGAVEEFDSQLTVKNHSNSSSFRIVNLNLKRDVSLSKRDSKGKQKIYLPDLLQQLSAWISPAQVYT